MNRPIVKLLAFYFLFLWTHTFLRAIVPPHAFGQGIGFRAMAIGLIVAFGTQTLFFLLFNNRTLTAKISWVLSMIAFSFSIIFVIDVKSDFQYYISAFFYGLNIFFFWFFYNTAHFEHTPKGRVGFSSGAMFAIPSFIGISAPVIAGFLGEINIGVAWAVSFLSLFVAVILIKFQSNFSLTLSLRKPLSEIASTRLLIFVSGVWVVLPMGVIPIYTLYFLKTTLEYGSFLAYLSFVSVFATLILGILSDRLKKRVIFLYPVTILIAVITLFFPVATQDLALWIVLSGLTAFMLPLYWNFTTAIIVDSSPNLKVSIPGREFTLAVGRVFGLFIMLLSFMFEPRPFFIFIFLAFFALAYPAILFWKSKVQRKYSYR